MTLPGDSSETLSALWAGTMPLTSLNKASADATSVLTGHHANDTQRFWSTPARSAGSPIAEVLQVNLGMLRTINTVSFEVSRFPCDIALEYFDPQSQVWTACLDAAERGTQAVTAVIRDSVPSALPPISSVTGHLHPQHSFSGHWQQLNFALRAVTTQHLRIVLIRSTAGVPPTDLRSLPAPYSLAVRGVLLQYVAKSQNDIPLTERQDDNNYATFARSTDMFGSSVSYSLRVNAAANVLRSTSAPDGGGLGQQLVWKCEPQPVPWAVVCFYLDVRDEVGNPQVIDRIYLDPLYQGPSLNVYSSTSEPTGRFTANPDPLPEGVAVINDPFGLGGNVLASGQAGRDEIAFVDVDNTALGFAPARSWWLGGRLHTKYRHDGTENADYPIFDCGAFHACLTPAGFRVATAFGDTMHITLDEYDAAANVTFLAMYDGAGTLGAVLRVGSIDYKGLIRLTAPLPSAFTLRLGGFLGESPGVNNVDLDTLVLKADDVPDAELADAFLADPAPYAEPPVFHGEHDARTDNALLRYRPSFSTDEHPAALIGGPPDRYADMVWSPVARDYTLQSGYLQLPPTRCGYLKLELSNLVPEVYDALVPITRTVSTFPANAASPASNTGTAVDAAQPGTTASWSVNLSLAVAQFLGGVLPYLGTGGLPGKTYTVTEVRLITDIVTNLRLAAENWMWRYLPSSSPSTMPVFAQTGRHVYETVSMEDTTKLGYFVGLRQAAAYRVDYASTDDTDQYIEFFHDTSSLARSNWRLEGDHKLHSGRADFAQATSVVYPSNRVVSALQFSATQSQPRQVLPDSDFDDPGHASWEAVGDAQFEPGVLTNPVVGSTLRMHRAQQYVTYNTLMANFPQWRDFADTAPSYAALASGFGVPSTAGGVSSGTYTSPLGGTVYVAARFLAPAKLSGSVYVELFDATDDTVLSATEVADPPPNKVIETYTGFDLGNESVLTWDGLVEGAIRLPMFDDFGRANATELGKMTSNGIWTTPVDGVGNEFSLDIVSNQAVATNRGQYNTIDTGSPWGALEFTVGTMGASGTPGPSGMPYMAVLAQIGGLALAPDGRLLSADGGPMESSRRNVLSAANSARPVAANDSIKVEIMPTFAVPAGKTDVTRTDSVVWPYSMLFYLNGSWVRTVSHDRGVLPTMSIKGNSGQIWKLWTWTPSNFGPPQQPEVVGLPASGNGNWTGENFGTDPTTGAAGHIWEDLAGHRWYAPQLAGWNTAPLAEQPGRDDYPPGLIAAMPNAEFTVDTNAFYGALSVYVQNVARYQLDSGVAVTEANFATSTGKHGMILVLDQENGVYLDYAGDVIWGGVSQGNLIPGGITDATTVTVQWARSAKVSDAQRGTINSGTYSDMLIGKVDGEIVGRFASTALVGWRGTWRGVAGDIWGADITATRPSGFIDRKLDTAFTSLHWAADASTVATDQMHKSWDNVTGGNTLTYDQLAAPKEGRLVKARLVQYGQSSDIIDVDTLSLFWDPIVWEFSTDGGYNFYRAGPIRNNPHGVLAFPTSVVITDINQRPGNALVWRVTSYAQNSVVSGLVIRPWYAGMLSGLTHRVGLATQGPNLMPYDQYGDIRDDARFRMWDKPIPQSWFFAYRNLARQAAAGSYQAPVEKPLTMPESIVIPGETQ